MARAAECRTRCLTVSVCLPPHCAGEAAERSDPGKPWQNGADERFNGKLRDECPSLEWFRSRKEVAVIIEAWRRHYNTVRPHSSLTT